MLSMESDSLSASSPVAGGVILGFLESLSSPHMCLSLDRDFLNLLEDRKFWGKVALWTCCVDGNLGLLIFSVSSNENWCFIWFLILDKGCSGCWTLESLESLESFDSWWCNCLNCIGWERGLEVDDWGCCRNVDKTLWVEWGEWIKWESGGGDREVTCNAGILTNKTIMKNCRFAEILKLLEMQTGRNKIDSKDEWIILRTMTAFL